MLIHKKYYYESNTFKKTPDVGRAISNRLRRKKIRRETGQKKTGKSNDKRHGLETNNPTYKNEVGFFLSLFPETDEEKKPEN